MDISINGTRNVLIKKALAYNKKYIYRKAEKQKNNIQDWYGIKAISLSKPLRATSLNSINARHRGVLLENSAKIARDLQREKLKARYKIYVREADRNFNDSGKLFNKEETFRDPDFIDHSTCLHKYSDESQASPFFRSCSSRSSPFTNELLVSSNISIDWKNAVQKKLSTVKILKKEKKHMKLPRKSLKFIKCENKEPLYSPTMSQVFLKRSLNSKSNTSSPHIFDVSDMFNISSGKIKLKR
ncbi:unnamed protein product [Blepharisma stoltei]|uniref:Uncharacterized protein n=1 Tax=Blepharisma stoltei TaxID=1481888 RepID=A0AAU9ICN7_9CILI|nr:unnamed protein product [Blepharisma stoltei]